MSLTDLSRPFRSTIVHADGGVTVELVGEIDLACVPQLRQSLDAAIDTSPGDVNIELSEVSFLDSTGLTVLIAAHDRLATTQRRLTVLNPSRTVCRVFEFSGLIEVFDVRPPAAETTER
jgi:anti-sigma B factor antagonist